jgi:hypothetical protein
MKIIARPMGTGKTEELLRIAAEDKALVFTENKAELLAKANSYGITVQIVDLDDLYENTSMYEGYDRVYIYKMDEMFANYLKDTFALELKGYSIRTEE